MGLFVAGVNPRRAVFSPISQRLADGASRRALLAEVSAHRSLSEGLIVASGACVELYAVADGTEWTDPFMMTTYADWQNPTVTGIKVTNGTLTIGVRFKCNVKSWGTVDDVTLNRISD